MSTISTDQHNPVTMTPIGRSLVKQLTDPDSLLPARQAPFDNLATEIIQTIFTCACPNVKLPAMCKSPANISTFTLDESDYLDPMVLATVCKRWRAVSRAHHALWATIIIDASMISQNDWNRWGFQQLSDRLERSGAYPLKITVEAYIGDENNNEEILGILDIVMPHSERWENIQFGFPCRLVFFQKLASIQGQLPLLESLHINVSPGLSVNTTSWASDSIKCCAPFALSPLCKTVCVSAPWGVDMVILRNIKIPWTQISSLTLDQSGLQTKQDLHEVLWWLSASLTHLTFMYSSPLFNDWYISNRKGPIVLPRLRRLCFEGGGTDMLDMLVCPTLEHLDIDDGNTHEITPFLDDLSCPLTHIHLFNLEKDDYKEILHNSSLSMLKSLSLDELTDPMLGLLVFDSRNSFPCLETLCLDLNFVLERKPQFITTQFERLQMILDSRTCGTSLDRLKPSINPFQPISSFKNYSIFLYLPSCPELGPNYAEIPLQKLRSCCVAWNVRLNLEFVYAT